MQWTTGLQPLADIANIERLVPREWISGDGFRPNEPFVEYARPLVEGEVVFPIAGGLPKYATPEKTKVEEEAAAARLHQAGGLSESSRPGRRACQRVAGG